MLILLIADIRLAACFVLVNRMDKDGMFFLQTWAIKTVLDSALSFSSSATMLGVEWVPQREEVI